MSVIFSNNYWLLGDGAEEEAKRWVANDERKRIVYSSPRAVQIEEHGNYLSPELPIPPEGFVVVVISDNEVVQEGLTLGVAHWDGDGGWIEPKDGPQGKEKATIEVKLSSEIHDRLVRWAERHGLVGSGVTLSQIIKRLVDDTQAVPFETLIEELLDAEENCDN